MSQPNETAQLEKFLEPRTQLESKVGAKDSSSPITRLPPEILCDIFYWMIVPTSLDDDKDRDDDPVWRKAELWSNSRKAILSVCKLWRSLGLECPSLWTEVDVLLGAYPLAISRFSRSGSLPLSVTVQVSFDHKDFRQELKKLLDDRNLDWLNRVQDLTWISGGHLNLSSYLTQQLASSGRLRSLRSLSMIPSRSRFSITALSAGRCQVCERGWNDLVGVSTWGRISLEGYAESPSFNILRLQNVMIMPSDRYPEFRNLRKIQIQDTEFEKWSDIRILLEHIPLIDTLVFQHNQVWDMENMYLPHREAEQDFRINLPYLRVLHLEHLQMYILGAMLSTIVCPGLLEMFVTLYGGNLLAAVGSLEATEAERERWDALGDDLFQMMYQATKVTNLFLECTPFTLEFIAVNLEATGGDGNQPILPSLKSLTVIYQSDDEHSFGDCRKVWSKLYNALELRGEHLEALTISSCLATTFFRSDVYEDDIRRPWVKFADELGIIPCKCHS